MKKKYSFKTWDGRHFCSTREAVDHIKGFCLRELSILSKNLENKDEVLSHIITTLNSKIETVLEFKTFDGSIHFTEQEALKYLDTFEDKQLTYISAQLANKGELEVRRYLKNNAGLMAFLNEIIKDREVER